MRRDHLELVKLLLMLGFAVFVFGLLLRITGHGDHNPFLNFLTPGALHRTANTLVLLGIGVGVYQLCARLAAGNGPEAPPDQPEPPAEPGA